eukprot:11174713-Lingulodinium_polyedra.AAC.1
MVLAQLDHGRFNLLVGHGVDKPVNDVTARCTLKVMESPLLCPKLVKACWAHGAGNEALHGAVRQ